MKLFDYFKKKNIKSHPDRFSDFFLHASTKEKMKIFTDAAQRANEEQNETFKRAGLVKMT